MAASARRHRSPFSAQLYVAVCSATSRARLANFSSTTENTTVPGIWRCRGVSRCPYTRATESESWLTRRRQLARGRSSSAPSVSSRSNLSCICRWSPEPKTMLCVNTQRKPPCGRRSSSLRTVAAGVLGDSCPSGFKPQRRPGWRRVTCFALQADGTGRAAHARSSS